MDIKEITKRGNGAFIIIPNPYFNRIKENLVCPICLKPKKEWERRKDWRCCSKECSDKLRDEIIYGWNELKLKAFRRDRFTCVKCGFKARKEQIITEDSKDWYNKNYTIFELSIENGEMKAVLGEPSQLIGDHIKPIALGGYEADIDNIQSLCYKCNKIKTKKDIKEINKVRLLIKLNKLNQRQL